ncbi:hypothetical protein ACFRDV_36925 [Streptomyces fagopyri]|uniref:hypothetical protein n=1 Tax=Streptomyces fagopyri TaxID=2662397 RepID=UPI0036C19633
MVTAMPAVHISVFAMADLLIPVNGNLLDFYNGDERLFRLYSGDRRAAYCDPDPLQRILGVPLRD